MMVARRPSIKRRSPESFSSVVEVAARAAGLSAADASKAAAAATHVLQHQGGPAKRAQSVPKGAAPPDAGAGGATAAPARQQGRRRPQGGAGDAAEPSGQGAARLRFAGRPSAAPR